MMIIIPPGCNKRYDGKQYIHLQACSPSQDHICLIDDCMFSKPSALWHYNLQQLLWTSNTRTWTLEPGHTYPLHWAKYAHLFIRLNMCKQKCLNTTFRVHTSRIIQRWILPAHSFNRAKVSVLRGQACVMKYLQICSTMYSGWGWAKYQHWLFKINIILHSQSWILGGVLLCKGTLWNRKPVWTD